MKGCGNFPLSHLIPIFLHVLPLFDDMMENPFVYICVIELLCRYKELMTRFVLHIVAAHSNELVQDELKVKISVVLHKFYLVNHYHFIITILELFC
jgi:hypothetical protein